MSSPGGYCRGSLGVTGAQFNVCAAQQGLEPCARGAAANGPSTLSTCCPTTGAAAGRCPGAGACVRAGACVQRHGASEQPIAHTCACLRPCTGSPRCNCAPTQPRRRCHLQFGSTYWPSRRFRLCSARIYKCLKVPRERRVIDDATRLRGPLHNLIVWWQWQNGPRAAQPADKFVESGLAGAA
jgi:hypothetical protein